MPLYLLISLIFKLEMTGPSKELSITSHAFSYFSSRGLHFERVFDLKGRSRHLLRAEPRKGGWGNGPFKNCPLKNLILIFGPVCGVFLFLQQGRI